MEFKADREGRKERKSPMRNAKKVLSKKKCVSLCQAFWICDFSFRFSCSFQSFDNSSRLPLDSELKSSSLPAAGTERCSQFRLPSHDFMHENCCDGVSAGKRLHLNFTFQPNFLGRFVPFSYNFNDLLSSSRNYFRFLSHFVLDAYVARFAEDEHSGNMS